MICKHCGKENIDNARFCAFCCNKLPGNNEQTQSKIVSQSKKKTDNFSIAGFVLSFLSPILGIVFSSLGYRQAHQEHSPKGLAIAGVIISIVSIIANLVIYVVFGTSILTLIEKLFA